MSNGAGEAEVFAGCGDCVQRGYLGNLFKGNEALVESIIDSIETVSQIPKTQIHVIYVILVSNSVLSNCGVLIMFSTF